MLTVKSYVDESITSDGVNLFNYEKHDHFVDIFVNRIEALLNLSQSIVLILKKKVMTEVQEMKLHGTNVLTSKNKFSNFNTTRHTAYNFCSDAMLQMQELLQYLKKSLHVPYLFEKSGNSRRSSLLLNMLKGGAVINFQKSMFQSYDVASALKSLFEVNQPLLFPSLIIFLHSVIVNSMNSKINQLMDNENICIEVLQLLMWLHPNHHAMILKDLFNLLHLFVKNYDNSCTKAEKLSEIFTPLLVGNLALQDIQKEEVDALKKNIACMILHADQVFQTPSCVLKLTLEQSCSKTSISKQPVVQLDKLKPLKMFQQSQKLEIKKNNSTFNLKKLNSFSKRISKSHYQSSKQKQLRTAPGKITIKHEVQPSKVKSSYWRLPQPGDDDDEDWLLIKNKENSKKTSGKLKSKKRDYVKSNNAQNHILRNHMSNHECFLSNSLVSKFIENQEDIGAKTFTCINDEEFVKNKKQRIIKVSMV